MGKRTKVRGPGCPQGTTKTSQTPQQPAILKSGCEAGRKMLPKLSWEMTRWVIMEWSWKKLVLSIWLGVENSVEGKAPHDYWETLLADPPLQEEGVLIGKMSKVPTNQPWLEDLGGVTEQKEPEEVWRWRSICWSSRIKNQGCCDIPFLVVGLAIFHYSGWDDQHLLLYIFQSLQVFPGDLARSLGEDATLTNVLQMLDEHYGIVCHATHHWLHNWYIVAPLISWCVHAW